MHPSTGHEYVLCGWFETTFPPARPLPHLLITIKDFLVIIIIRNVLYI